MLLVIIDIGIAVKKIATMHQKYVLPESTWSFCLSQMKLQEQHKAEQLFQLGYVLVIEFASSHSHSIVPGGLLVI